VDGERGRSVVTAGSESIRSISGAGDCGGAIRFSSHCWRPGEPLEELRRVSQARDQKYARMPRLIRPGVGTHHIQQRFWFTD